MAGNAAGAIRNQINQIGLQIVCCAHLEEDINVVFVAAGCLELAHEGPTTGEVGVGEVDAAHIGSVVIVVLRVEIWTGDR